MECLHVHIVIETHDNLADAIHVYEKAGYKKMIKRRDCL